MPDVASKVSPRVVTLPAACRSTMVPHLVLVHQEMVCGQKVSFETAGGVPSHLEDAPAWGAYQVDLHIFASKQCHILLRYKMWKDKRGA